MTTKSPDLKMYDYRKIPALALYIDRIGAEQLRFNRFIIKERKGNYYTERSMISINEEGDTSSNNPEYAPTKEEAAQIKGALMSVKWPQSIGAKSIDPFIKASGADKKNLYEFWDRKTETITMVQERRQSKDGAKTYLPWCMFDDGEVRMMEPKGKLPFWKPRKKTSNLIMIHEGAKTGRYVDWMINSEDAAAEKLRATHPWADELKDYEHWGMIGGALAPHRANYNELSQESPMEIVYVCDNDAAGKSVIEEVSRRWRGTLKGLYFDEAWPATFDLADAFDAKTCPSLFGKKGRYIGNAMRSLLFPATHATELVLDGSRKRSIVTLNRAFEEEWYHCIKPEVYVHKMYPNQVLTANEFNNKVNPFSDTEDTSRLLKRDQAGKGGILAYDPSRPPGIYGSHDNLYLINTHVPSSIKSDKGSPAIFEEYMEYMIPDKEDLLEAKRWVATLISQPHIKMHYGMLLISETQGVGKSTLGERVLKPLLGDSNVASPSEADIVESNFNYWCAHKRLAVVNEIYAGHSSRAYDKLKGMITDKVITVSAKYLASYDIDNWIHILACSNSMRALKLSADDRRWFVPKVVEYKKPQKFWQQFNEWLEEENGLGIIKQWAQDFVKKNGGVLMGETSPWSKAKEEVIREGFSPGQMIVSEALDGIANMCNGHDVIVTDASLVQLIKDQLYNGSHSDKLERPLTVRKVAKQKGWHICEEIVMGRKHWGARPGQEVRLITNKGELKLKTVAELEQMGLGPFDLTRLAVL